MQTTITRNDAAAAGFKFYYTGKPCAAGHDARRYTSTGSCVECMKGRARTMATNIKRGRVARLSGHFSYNLHPDDHAAALAYCQALDMSRGLAPQQPTAAPVRKPWTPEEIHRARELAFGRVLPRMADTYEGPPLGN